MIEIEYLVDVPYYLPVVATWVFREWCREDGSLGQVVSRYKQRLSRGRIPLTLVAVKDGASVGVISLKLDELPTRPDLFPWLGSLYVVPEHRGEGIGMLLVRRAEFIAQEQGVGMLFAFTDSLGNLCEREGWVYIGDEPYRNEKNVSIYGKNIMSP
jgi:GNAT superfamily N-acetyltransferase